MNQLYSRTQLKPEVQGDQAVVFMGKEGVHLVDFFPLAMSLAELQEQLAARRKDFSVERMYLGVSQDVAKDSQAADTFISLCGIKPVPLDSLDQALVQERYLGK